MGILGNSSHFRKQFHLAMLRFPAAILMSSIVENTFRILDQQIWKKNSLENIAITIFVRPLWLVLRGKVDGNEQQLAFQVYFPYHPVTVVNECLVKDWASRVSLKKEICGEITYLLAQPPSLQHQHNRPSYPFIRLSISVLTPFITVVLVIRSSPSLRTVKSKFEIT